MCFVLADNLLLIFLYLFMKNPKRINLFGFSVLVYMLNSVQVLASGETRISISILVFNLSGICCDVIEFRGRSGWPLELFVGIFIGGSVVH